MHDALRIGVFGWFLLSGLAFGGSGGAEPVSSSGGAAVDALVEPRQPAPVSRLLPDVAQACLPVGSVVPPGAAQTGIALTLGLIAESPVGAWLVAQGAARSVVVCNDPATDLAAYYRSQIHLIGLLETLEAPAKVVFLAHELAHVPQHPRYSNNRRFGAKAMIVLHRLREATAEAIATRILWQLRQRGHDAPWKRKLDTGYGDIARRFARIMAETGEELAATRGRSISGSPDPAGSTATTPASSII